MEPVTIKRGDKHSLQFTVAGAPVDLNAGTVKVLVAPSLGGAAETFPATIADNVVTWVLDGTLEVGKYRLEVEVAVSGYIVTAPSDGYVELVVMQDLG